MIEALAKDSKCAVPLTTSWMHDTEGDGTLFIAKVGSDKAKKRILLASNEHAREMVTAEVSLAFIQSACSTGASSALKSSLMEESSEPKTSKVDKSTLLHNVQYIIVPVVNEKGRALVEQGSEPCQRMTTDAEGAVDLNRNMDVDWGKGEPQAWGEKPFSTYQARILRDLAAKEKPVAYIDLHTGARSLMTSWGYRPSTDPDFADQDKVLKIIQKNYCPDCDIGSNRVVIGYTNPGEVIDHMYEKQKIKYSTLWEVYAGDGDCVENFNPPDSKYTEVTQNWANAIMTFGDYVHTSVDPNEHSHPGSLADSDAEDPRGPFNEAEDDGEDSSSSALMEESEAAKHQRKAHYITT